MKKKFLLLTLVMFVLSSCSLFRSSSTDQTSEEPIATDTGSSDSTNTNSDTGSNSDSNEIDSTQIDLFFNREVYSLLPPIFSSNYQFANLSNPTLLVFGVVVYDWDEDDNNAYNALLENEFAFDEDKKAYVVDENLFAIAGPAIDIDNNFISYCVAIFSYIVEKSWN